MFRYVMILLTVIFLSSCATPRAVPPMPVAYPVKAPYQGAPGTRIMPRHDISHIVAPGETLWRISKMYDVAPGDIVRANALAAQPVLRKGDKLLVPHAAPVQPIISLYPSNRWEYIIIHHSATDEGDSLLFDKAHLSKGWDGVGYHFIIDNGSKGHSDGQVEVSPRWLKQVPGAHCKADGMNEKAIGICLVGNFNDSVPSHKQLAALVDLVNKLQTYYKIPGGHVTGHGKVRGASTDCPGKRFPWAGFFSRLRSASVGSVHN